MNQFDALLQCMAMCGLMGAFCALLAVPIFVWLAVRAVAPQIRSMSNDGHWQAPLAAISAALPSLLFLSIAGMILSTVAHLPSSTMLVCRVSMIVIEIAIMAGVARAAVCTAHHCRESHRIIARSLPPSAHVQDSASRYGVRIRELDDEVPFCGVAGIVRPVVLVSRGALARLSDDELDAALLHERSHIRRFDQLLAAVLTFCVDCVPLPAGDLVKTYRTARESVADSDAAALVDPRDLAGAILALAAGTRDSHAFAALSSSQCLQARLRVLIEPPQYAAPTAELRARRVLLSAWLAAIAILSSVPFIEHTFHI